MSKAEAQEREREILRKVDDRNWTEDRAFTVADLLMTWLQDNEHRIAAKTWESYDSKVRLHIIPVLGEIPLAKLRPKHIVDAYAAIRAKGLSAQTSVHLHRILHTAMNYGKKTLRIVKENVFADVPSPAAERRDMASLSEKQVRLVLEAAKETRLEIPVVVAALTGLRRSELLALRWGTSLDFERGLLSVNETLEQSRRYGLRFKRKMKTKSSRRVIPLAADLVEMLKAHKDKQDDRRRRLGLAWTANDLVFCNEDGSPWPPDTFSKQFAGIMRLVGLEGVFRFHDSRHAFASIALKNGASVKEVSTLLGHSSPTLTLSTYAHVMEGMGREAVNGLARSLLVPRQGEKSS